MSVSLYESVSETIRNQWSVTHVPPVHPMFPLRWYGMHSNFYLPIDWICIYFGIAVLFTIGRYVAAHILFMPFLRSLKVPERDVPRWLESLWQGFYYFGVWILCYYAVKDEPFFTETWRCWEPPIPFQTISALCFWLYAVQIGWYTHCIYAHVLLDPRKSDFYEMLFHHVATILLMYCSLAIGFWRVGVLVFYCLDLCDVILHICKILRLVDNIFKLTDLTKAIFFLPLPTSWLYFRILLFGYKVLYTTIMLPWMYAGWPNADYIIFFNILLIFVWLLQVMWFYFIMRTAYLKVMHGLELDDVRDPSAENDEGKVNPDKKKKQ